MLPVQLDPLLLRIHLVSLVINKVAPVNHPEVEINIDLELLSLGQ
jgi:hypothetical protein